LPRTIRAPEIRALAYSEAETLFFYSEINVFEVRSWIFKTTWQETEHSTADSFLKFV
jgi:hypothetical protein